jgi:hypothetical protein
MSGVGGLGNPQAVIAAVVLCEHAATLAMAKAEVDTKVHVATSPDVSKFVTICLEGLADDVAVFYWLTSMVENNP